MKSTIWGMMILILCYATQALADYDVYDSRGNLIERVKSDYSVAPFDRTDSTMPATLIQIQTPVSTPTLSIALEGTPGPWTGGVAAGFSPSLTGFDPSYSLGYGLEANVGYQFNSHWAFLLTLDAYLFPSTYSGWYANQIDFVPVLRYSFGGGGIRPYLFAGVGGSDNLMIEPGGLVNGINLAVVGGLGVEFPVAPRLDIFIQGKYDYIITADGTFSYAPICAGVQFN